jgi:hypothetical protein
MSNIVQGNGDIRQVHSPGSQVAKSRSKSMTKRRDARYQTLDTFEDTYW